MISCRWTTTNQLKDCPQCELAPINRRFESILSHSFQKSYKPFVPDFFEGIKDSTNEVLHMFTRYIFRLSNQPILHSWYNFQHSARLTCWIQNNANQLHICLCTQTRRQLHSQTLVSLSAKNHAWILALWHKFEENNLLHQLRLEHTSYSQINKTNLLSVWHLLHNFSTEDVDLPWHGKVQICTTQTKATHQ